MCFYNQFAFRFRILDAKGISLLTCLNQLYCIFTEISACIGIEGIAGSGTSVAAIIASVTGMICGELLDIDGYLLHFGTKLKSRTNSSNGNISEGFVAATILFCSGSMSILGAIQAGTSGDSTTLIAKAVLDGIEAVMMAASLGYGVSLSGICVLIYEGSIVLLSDKIIGFMAGNVLTDITATGSIILIVLGLNLMGITRIKTANMLPAMVFSPFITLMVSALAMV